MSKNETSLQVGADPLTAALEYHRLGWSLLPIKAGTKKPAVRAWKSFQQAPADEVILRDWFDHRDDLGLAVICGPVSGGLTARDFDVSESFNRWATEHPELARTLPTVTTARGAHVYFRSELNRNVTYADGELRGNGYCLLPPSVHPSGHRYRWTVPLTETIPTIDPNQVGLAGAGHATESTESNGEQQSNCSVVSGVSGVSVVSGISAVSVALCCTSDDAIDKAILDCLPKGPGERHRQVFELARGLKAVPSLTDADANTLRPYVIRWHELAKPVIKTQPFDETWIDFLRAWPRVTFAKGAEPMARILAVTTQSDPPSIAQQYEQQQLRSLVSLRRELQRNSGTNPFFLSVRTAGRLLATEHTKAWRWLWLLEQDGVLLATERGSKATRKATRFRYLADLTE